MAETDEIVIPPEGDGEPLPPPKPRRPHVKGITFRDFDHVKDFEDLVRTVVTLCNPEEQERLREMEDWIVKNEGTWVLAEGFNSLRKMRAPGFLQRDSTHSWAMCFTPRVGQVKEGLLCSGYSGMEQSKTTSFSSLDRTGRTISS